MAFKDLAKNLTNSKTFFIETLFSNEYIHEISDIIE